MMPETGFAFLVPLLGFLGEQLLQGAAVVGLSLALSPSSDMTEDEQRARATARLDPATMATLYARSVGAAAQAYARLRAAGNSTQVAAIAAAHGRLNAYLAAASSLAQAQGATLAFEQFCERTATGAAAPAVAAASLEGAAPTSSAGMSTMVKLAIGGAAGALVLMLARGRR